MHLCRAYISMTCYYNGLFCDWGCCWPFLGSFLFWNWCCVIFDMRYELVQAGS